jgi:outer membrane lipoprotein
MRPALPLALVLLLAACAAAPPISAPPPESVAPFEVASAIERHLEQELLWGGMVIETHTFEHHSEIEVLAFPLDRQQRPVPHAADLGRFILLRHGFLDPDVFAPGRFVTVRGRVTGERNGRIRQAAYRWPELDAAELHLWPADFRQPRSHWSFSVGVGIHR